MTDIVPVPNWGGVRQLETNEYATGGLNGNMNEQAKSLAGQNMYSRLYAGLPFDPVFAAQVGGFPIGGKAALTNGDIVRSIIANNNNDPDVDMTGWEFAQKKTQFSSIAELRAIENIETNEKVYLKGLVEGSELGFGNWYYDAADTTSADNGWFIVVTNIGKRLKRVGLADVIDLDWAGIADQGDLAVRWQEAIDYADALRIANGELFNSPSIKISGGRYTMSKGVTHPPYLSTLFRGSFLLEVSYLRSVSDSVIKLQSKNNTYYMYDSVSGMSWNLAITTQVGKGVIRWVGDSLTTSEQRPSGIITGNVFGSINTYSANCRVENLEFKEFYASHEILGKDSWGFTFNNCRFNGNPSQGRYGIVTSSTTNTNSGERCNYNNSFYSGILLKMPGMYLYLTNCSFDYVQGNILKIESTAAYQDIRFIGGSHMEMFNFIVESDIVSSPEDVQIYISDTHILSNGFDLQASHDRILFKGRMQVNLRDVFLESPIYCSKTIGATMVSDGAVIKFSNVHNATNRPRVEENKIVSRRNNFLPDTVGQALSNTLTLINFESRNGNGMSAVSAAVALSPEKTTNCLQITVNSNTGYANIVSTEMSNVISGRRYVSRPVIELVDPSLTGKVKPFIDWFDRDGVFISRSTVSYEIPLQNYITGAQVSWVDRETKLIPIIHQSFVAPVGAARAKQGVTFESLTTGNVYYLHFITLYDSIEN